MRNWNARRMSCAGLQFALLCSSPFLLFSQSTDKASTTAAAAALPAYGGCPAPSQEGVKICAPFQNSFINGPFQVIASGTSGRGQVTLMELWADGKKVTQTNGTPFDSPVTLPVGTHELTVIEVSTTGASAKSAPLKVTVENNSGETCPLPPGPRRECMRADARQLSHHGVGYGACCSEGAKRNREQDGIVGERREDRELSRKPDQYASVHSGFQHGYDLRGGQQGRFHQVRADRSSILLSL